MSASGRLEGRVAIGCMRLSTAPDRDTDRAVAVLHAAFDAGITLLDTADVYCWDDSERGHNERLIAAALATWRGDGSSILVATKGGLTRPGGRWEPDGRARHLTSACEASLRALGLTTLPLYQLHVVDPRTSLATSVRALAALQRNGLVQSIGLCNVTVGQIEEAREIAEIASVQVELSVLNDAPFLSGVLEYCVDHRIPVLAYRPLGGPAAIRRIEGHPALTAVAAERGATACEIALAWLRDLSEWIVPLPGVTRLETARSAARSVTLTDDDRRVLDAAFPIGREFRERRRQPGRVTPTRTDGEVVLIMGMPGAGKSTLAQSCAADGYRRLNRDDEGGTLRELAGALDAALASGASRVVLDNTYPSRKSRAEVVRVANAHALPTRCVWLTTTLEDAQVNAATRIVRRFGRLLADDDLKQAAKRDRAAMLPTAQFRYQRELEAPDIAEGFVSVDTIPFARTHSASASNRALIVWCDGVVLQSRSGARVPRTVEDLTVPGACGDLLRRYRDEGWRLLGMSWQPDIASGGQSVPGLRAVLATMNELLGVEIEVEFCPHAAGPPACWCRKPLPGLGVVFIERHALDPAACVYVGHSAQDPGFARRLGFRYADSETFFTADERHT